MECPFSCGYKASNEYGMLLHMETQHPEDDSTSPFVVQADTEAVPTAVHDVVDDSRGWKEEVESEEFVSCPVDGCGEEILLTELEGHVEMHGEEGDFSSSASPEAEPGEVLPPTADSSSKNVTKRKRGILDPTHREDDFSSGNGVANQKHGFGIKLAHALRNLEDVDVQVHERGERSERRGQKNGHGGAQSVKSAWGKILKMPDATRKRDTARRSKSPTRGSGPSPMKVVVKRLGKAELGPHANEKQMPEWLVKLLQDNDGKLVTINQLEKDGKTRRAKSCPNMAANIVPVIAQLLDLDPNVAYAYVCDPAVKHVSKLMKEGGFCGYRNIQMMTSYITGAGSQGHEILDNKIPTIFEIQEHIETAWDNGINAQGRIETGGVRGTRKYIGTSEAQAMLLLLGISCDAQAFKTHRTPTTKQAHDSLLTFVESYFTSGCATYDPKIRRTTMPPIYFQHPGHSMTIIGFQKSIDGGRELLVFDPMFHDSPQVLRLAASSAGGVKVNGGHLSVRKAEELLKAYRRGTKYLRRYGEFEILRLTTPGHAQSVA